MSVRTVIDQQQMSEMGSGFGHYEFPKETSLRHILDWIKACVHDWGIVTIRGADGRVIRRFDYNLYNNSIFYHYLNGWEYDKIVYKVEFKYCYMNNDIDIYLK